MKLSPCLFLCLFIAAFIIVTISRWRSGAASRLEILKIRHARGEIAKEKYDRLKEEVK